MAASARTTRDALERRALAELADRPILANAAAAALKESTPGAASKELTELLRLVQRKMDADVIAVLDTQGHVVAGVGPVEPLAQTVPWIDPEARLLVLKQRYFYLTAIRLPGGGYLAKGADFDFNQFGGPTVLARAGVILESQVPGFDRKTLAAALAQCGTNCEVGSGGETYLALSTPDLNLGGGYELRTLQSPSQAAGALRSAIQQVFTIAAAAAFALIFLVSIVSARSIGSPLTAFLASLRESEDKGTLVPFQISSRIEEIDELARAFNRAAHSISESQGKLARAQLDFIEAMASALDARDVYTAGHSRRVADYACATAIEMGVSEPLIGVIRVGALLHDVGKIGIPDSILLKPGALTPEEIQVVQMHPAIGRQIVERIVGFESYLPIIELHHENHDGSGYPRGLKGDQIPIGTRIVHVVDAFDAMTSDRPYRRGMSAPDALQRMSSVSGKQFDPYVLEAFRKTQAATASLISAEPKVRDYVQLARGLDVTAPSVAEPRD